MDGLKTLILVLTPLFIGFMLRVPRRYLRILDKLLSWLVCLILLLIGIGLAREEHLTTQLTHIMRYTILLFPLIILSNILILMLFDKKQPICISSLSKARTRFSDLFGGIKQLIIVLMGVLLGVMLPGNYLPPAFSSTVVLMLLVFTVGLQLRAGEIPLHQVLLNKRGWQTALWFIASCLLSGTIFAAMLPEVAWTQGLALASGYGWYSLSGIVMTHAYGTTWGSVALFNDLLREFFALVCIPILMRRYPSTAVGIGGVTSLDFALPVIQQSGGIGIVPVAISFGFIVNLVSPFLMLIFSSFQAA